MLSGDSFLAGDFTSVATVDCSPYRCDFPRHICMRPNSRYQEASANECRPIPAEVFLDVHVDRGWTDGERLEFAGGAMGKFCCEIWIRCLRMCRFSKSGTISDLHEEIYFLFWTCSPVMIRPYVLNFRSLLNFHFCFKFTCQFFRFVNCFLSFFYLLLHHYLLVAISTGRLWSVVLLFHYSHPYGIAPCVIDEISTIFANLSYSLWGIRIKVQVSVWINRLVGCAEHSTSIGSRGVDLNAYWYVSRRRAAGMR